MIDNFRLLLEANIGGKAPFEIVDFGDGKLAIMSAPAKERGYSRLSYTVALNAEDEPHLEYLAEKAGADFLAAWEAR